MKPKYVLIDHENVQPKDLRLLDGQALKVIVFLGASQQKISAELATALLAPTDDKLGTVIAHLKGMGARPRRAKTLASTINAKLGKGLDEGEIQAIVDELERCGVVAVKDGKVTYAFTAES